MTGDPQAAGPDGTPTDEQTAVHRVASPPGGGMSARRWGIALVVVALVVAVVAAGAFLLTGRDDPTGLAYVAEDSVAVIEVRPDLPGDQRQKLGNLLSKFPGFADQASLEEKIDEALDRLVATASDGEVNYRDDVKPYVGGPAIVALRSLPASEDERVEQALFIATSEVTCAEHFGDGTSTTTETHEGTELTIADDPTMGRVACASVAPHLLLGDVDSVKRGLDTKRSGNDITGAATYQAAQEALPGDRVGFLYFDARAIAEAVEDAGAENPIGGLSGDQTPEWAAFRLSLADDALVVDLAAPDPTKAGGASQPPRTAPPSKVSTLAPRLPASTIAAFESHGWGVGILNALDAARADPELAPQLQQLEQAALLLGGVDGLFGWMGDGTLVLTRDGADLGGGLVIEAANVDDARARLDQLKGFLLLAGAGAGISIEDVEHGEATITVVDLGDLGGLLGGASPLPLEPDSRIEIAYTVHDGLVVFGPGPDFVEAVLDTEAGSTLADQPTYQRAIELAGATNDAQGYADLGALAELAAEQLDAADAERYTTEIKPYVDPLDGAGVMIGRSGDLVVGRIVLVAN